MSTTVDAASVSIPTSRPKGPQGIDLRVLISAVFLFAIGTVYLQAVIDWRQATLFLLGGFFGLFLYHASFGFTRAWRVFIADRRGAGLRAQMLMLSVACLLFFPVLQGGTPIFTESVRGNVNPVGIAVAVGAFLFGIGMQIGGGCASGTLFAVGGGSTRMLVTLFGFIVGSLIGTAHAPWWQSLPAFPAVSVVEAFGAGTGLMMSLGLFGAIAAVTWHLERRHHGEIATQPNHNVGWRRALQGPWPLLIGAVGLAVGNFATLALAGRPWGITSGFALWGAKAASAGGVDVSSWTYWSTQTASLEASVFEHATSVMDFGIIIGALAAAGLAGRFRPTWSLPARSVVAALIGGLLLGYGARLAYGCNIGAYFSGIASGSLHGWLWLVAAFAGSILGTQLRPVFGMKVERTKSESTC